MFEYTQVEEDDASILNTRIGMYDIHTLYVVSTMEYIPHVFSIDE